MIYLFLYSRFNIKKSFGNQRIKYTISPTIDIITRKLSSHQLTTRSSNISDPLIIHKCSNRRQSSIVDSKLISQIQFALPTNVERLRRRSIAICNNLNEPKQSSIHSLIQTQQISNEYQPILISFLLDYSKVSSTIQICFQSITLLPNNIQKLNIKIRLLPDGKTKNFEIKRIYPNINPFMDENIEDCVQFSNVQQTKFSEKALIMKVFGRDQAKKLIQLGQIGKICFNQLKAFPMEFMHEIETIKPSSIEIFVRLQQSNDHTIVVDIQRAKGLKIDQKISNANGFFQIVLLDRHRPLSTYQTKTFRLNSSSFVLEEPIDLNILAFHPNNFDRIMIMIYFYANLREHQCLGRVKLSSTEFTSGTGTIQWQQFKDQQEFSMWHTLIKQ